MSLSLDRGGGGDGKTGSGCCVLGVGDSFSGGGGFEFRLGGSGGKHVGLGLLAETAC